MVIIGDLGGLLLSVYIVSTSKNGTGGWSILEIFTLTPRGVSCAPVERTPLGVAERPLHSFLANARTFRKAWASAHGVG